MRNLLLEVFNLERGEEAEGSHVKGHDGGHALLEEGRGIEEGPVATQAHNEVDLVCQVVTFREGLQLVLKNRSGY